MRSTQFLATFLGALVLISLVLAAPYEIQSRPAFDKHTDSDVTTCSNGTNCTQAERNWKACLYKSMGYPPGLYESYFMDCLCDFKEPTFGLSVQRCAACVEKDNDFISSKVDPQFWTPLCHHRNMTIQQFSLGIYNLGADNLLPIDLPFGTVATGKTDDLPWSSYTIKPGHSGFGAAVESFLMTLRWKFFSLFGPPVVYTNADSMADPLGYTFITTVSGPKGLKPIVPKPHGFKIPGSNTNKFKTQASPKDLETESSSPLYLQSSIINPLSLDQSCIEVEKCQSAKAIWDECVSNNNQNVSDALGGMLDQQDCLCKKKAVWQKAILTCSECAVSESRRLAGFGKRAVFLIAGFCNPEIFAGVWNITGLIAAGDALTTNFDSTVSLFDITPRERDAEFDEMDGGSDDTTVTLLWLLCCLAVVFGGVGYCFG